MMNARQLGATPVRLEPELRDYLKHKAIDNRRSLTGEIAFRLQESREREEACKQQARAR